MRRRPHSKARLLDELVHRLEELHMLVVEAEAFLSAFDAVYSNTAWPTDKDPERRRDLNRMGCFIEALNARLAKLIVESETASRLVLRIR